jgi:hypothetical protein
MTKVEAARIIEKFVNDQMRKSPYRREITGVEEHALRKAVKALRRGKQNEQKEVV